jgi:CelD/BcsL family acetyltransferase involved in cellulose biosynthesis
MAFAIESAIREKSQRIDMLRGDYQYKSAWAKEVRTTFRTIVYRNTPRARLHRFRHLVLPRFKRRVIAAFKR